MLDNAVFKEGVLGTHWCGKTMLDNAVFKEGVLGTHDCTWEWIVYDIFNTELESKELKVFSKVSSVILYHNVQACCCCTNNISNHCLESLGNFLKKKILWPGYAVKRELQKIKLEDVGLTGGNIEYIDQSLCPYYRNVFFCYY